MKTAAIIISRGPRRNRTSTRVVTLRSGEAGTGGLLASRDVLWPTVSTNKRFALRAAVRSLEDYAAELGWTVTAGGRSPGKRYLRPLGQFKAEWGIE